MPLHPTHRVLVSAAVYTAGTMTNDRCRLQTVRSAASDNRGDRAIYRFARGQLTHD